MRSLESEVTKNQSSKNPTNKSTRNRVVWLKFLT